MASPGTSRPSIVAVGTLVLFSACGGEGGGVAHLPIDTTDTIDTADRLPDPECQTAQDCFDQVGPLGPCQVAVCLAGESVCAVEAVSDGSGCDDGDPCTDADQCLAGACVSGQPIVCDDGNPCTTEDSCVDGDCVFKGNICQCQQDADCLEFEDADLCNGTLRCGEDEGGATVCEVDPETVVTCEAADACTEPGTCSEGSCLPGNAVNCDDGNPCTDDACDPGTGCVHLDNASCGACESIECLGCSYGVDCAAEGPFIGETCCAEGDNLFYLTAATAHEVVDLETDGTFSVACGGFGVDVHDVTTPTQPIHLGGAPLPRCQRIAFGAQTSEGAQIVYIAHHGDTNGQSFFGVYHLTSPGGLQPKGQWSELDVLYEGMTWADGVLLVAAHSGGLRVYTTDAAGLPTLQATLAGFENAVKVAMSGAYAYVADSQGGLKVVHVGDPTAPQIVQAVETSGKSNDVIAHQGRVYVSLGGGGVDVFDATDPGELVFADHIETLGSVQAVAADGDLLALASWSHLALHSASTLQLLGTEQVNTFPGFDQILGVEVIGDHIFVGEWYALHILEYREGLVGPDLWIQDELLSFDGSEAGAQAVIMRNLGVLDLEIQSIQTSGQGHFSVDKNAATIPPGEAAVVEVLYTPNPGAPPPEKVVFHTNDPDSYQSPYQLHLVANDNNKLNVGDPLPASFGFLDPTGSGQVANLEGKVVVLAYFALF